MAIFVLAMSRLSSRLLGNTFHQGETNDTRSRLLAYGQRSCLFEEDGMDTEQWTK